MSQDQINKKSQALGGNTLLIDAVYNNDLQKVKHLLQMGADPSVKGRENGTALHWAIRIGRADYPEFRHLINFQMIKMLLDNRLTKKTLDEIDGFYGYTPLIWAIYIGRLDIMKLLIKAGANPKIPSRDGKTPFVFSLQNEDPSFFRFLLKHLNYELTQQETQYLKKKKEVLEKIPEIQNNPKLKLYLINKTLQKVNPYTLNQAMEQIFKHIDHTVPSQQILHLIQVFLNQDRNDQNFRKELLDFLKKNEQWKNSRFKKAILAHYSPKFWQRFINSIKIYFSGLSKKKKFDDKLDRLAKRFFSTSDLQQKIDLLKKYGKTEISYAHHYFPKDKKLLDQIYRKWKEMGHL